MRDSRVVMLLVEDNPADVFFFREAVDATGLPVCLRVVDNGDAALAFVRRQGQFADADQPDVMVLDLNVPVRNGREVLEGMAADGTLRQIPVVIFTTSETEEHLVQLYPAGRCRYMVKTSDFDRLKGIVGEIFALAKEQGQPDQGRSRTRRKNA